MASFLFPMHGHLNAQYLRHVYMLLNHYRWYEYLAIFVGTILEGEIVLITAGFLAFNGAISICAVIVVGFLGAVTGDNIWYAVGKWGGQAFIDRYGKFLLLSKKRIDRAAAYFTKHGQKTIFLSRFVFGTRVGSATLAGTFGMSIKRFLLSNAVGAITWVLITTLIGYYFGHSFHGLRRAVHGTEMALLILAAAAFILAIIRILVTQHDQ